MKIDYTLYIKGRCEDSYYKKYVRGRTPTPEHWDKNNFITWILCGESRLSAPLPKFDFDEYLKGNLRYYRIKANKQLEY